MRSAGSHSLFDIIAINPLLFNILLIQCKNKNANKKEMEDFALVLNKLGFGFKNSIYRIYYITRSGYFVYDKNEDENSYWRKVEVIE